MFSGPESCRQTHASNRICDRLNDAECSKLTMDLTICENPIFVIGSPRSGTSALGWALGQHSQLVTLVESSILEVLFSGQYAEKAYETAKARPNGRNWVMQYDVSQSEFLGYLGAGLNALMASRCPGNSGLSIHLTTRRWSRR